MAASIPINDTTIMISTNVNPLPFANFLNFVFIMSVLLLPRFVTPIVGAFLYLRIVPMTDNIKRMLRFHNWDPYSKCTREFTSTTAQS